MSTSQAQSATQSATTTQSAAAAGSPSTPTGAGAINVATTIQLIVQTQLGCVAFCYETSQLQSASQSASTNQTATATADAVVAAINVAEITQFVWQIQEGCTIECHDATTSQSVSRDTTTDQSSSAPPFDDPESFIAWIAVIAAQTAATVQTIFQYDEAACLDQCTGDHQSQDAVQIAATTQQTTATLSQDAAPAPTQARDAAAPAASDSPGAAGPGPAAQPAPTPGPSPAVQPLSTSGPRTQAPERSAAVVAADFSTARHDRERDAAGRPGTTAPPAPAIHAHGPAAGSATHGVRRPPMRVPQLQMPAVRPSLLAYRDGREGTGGGAWLLWGCGLLAAALTVRRGVRRTR